jgi:hypothetical protein
VYKYIYIYIYIVIYYVALVQYISCVQKWLIWFYGVLLWFDSLLIVNCELKHVGIFSLILQQKYARNNFVLSVGIGP